MHACARKMCLLRDVSHKTPMQSVSPTAYAETDTQLALKSSWLHRTHTHKKKSVRKVCE